jgi:Ca2+-binding RTX toxin-like protein
VEDIIALQDAPINLVGNEIDNLMVGNSGDNVIQGRSGADTLVGEAGSDVLIGGAGADILVGSDGDDDLSGGNGIDILDGGTGDDLLEGGNGRDILLGAEGNNTLVGGGGSDRFTVEFPGSEFDVVLDFETGLAGDRIVLAEDVLDVELSNSVLGEYIQMTSTNGSISIAIDRDGGGNSFVAVARLDNLAGLPASNVVVADDGSLMITSTG